MGMVILFVVFQHFDSTSNCWLTISLA